MTRKTMSRAAILVAAGLLLCTTAPTRAVEGGDNGGPAAERTAETTKPVSLAKSGTSKVKKAGRVRKAKVADAKAGKRKASEARAARSAPTPTAELPDNVANARAQLPAADAKADTRGEAAMAPATPMDAAAADQLTELDRAMVTEPDEPRRIATQLVQNDQPQLAMPVVVPEPPQRPATQVRSAPTGDPWAQSSLIGKIFIAFGGMLTLASAARMLVA